MREVQKHHKICTMFIVVVCVITVGAIITAAIQKLVVKECEEETTAIIGVKRLLIS